MAQCLLKLLFFTGAVHLTLSVPPAYYLIQEAKTWSDAQDYCRTHYTDLAVIKSNDDMIQLQNEAQSQQFNSGAWIGLYREHVSFYWSLGSEPLGSFTFWNSGQPDNSGGIQWCGMIRPVGWHDRECIHTLPFVCFDDTKIGNERYIYVSTGMSWHHAQAYCRNHYTDLASARDTTENSVLLSLVPGFTWFGLTTESWKWTDHSSILNISWMSGEPDIIQGDATCAYLNNNGQAADALCSVTMPFFCSSGIKQQIMRMEVRSNKEVNDPAVMDAIMEQIQQKLEERGLAGNVTVKWRGQPDGQVFHKKEDELQLLI